MFAAGVNGLRGPFLLPARYCGIHDPAAVVMCNATKKWFCNGRGNTSARCECWHVWVWCYLCVVLCICYVKCVSWYVMLLCHLCEMHIESVVQCVCVFVCVRIWCVHSVAASIVCMYIYPFLPPSTTLYIPSSPFFLQSHHQPLGAGQVQRGHSPQRRTTAGNGIGVLQLWLPECVCSGLHPCQG